MASHLDPAVSARRCAAGTTAAVLLLYAAACLMPAIDCGPGVVVGDPGFIDLGSGCHPGLVLLLFGWDRSGLLPWSANVFLGLGLFGLFVGRYRAALWLGAVASLLGLTTWWVRRHDTLLAGYYLWQASEVVLAAGAARSALWAAGRLPAPDVGTVEEASTKPRKAGAA